jgi:hypothetical protein
MDSELRRTSTPIRRQSAQAEGDSHPAARALVRLAETLFSEFGNT